MAVVGIADCQQRKANLVVPGALRTIGGLFVVLSAEYILLMAKAETDLACD